MVKIKHFKYFSLMVSIIMVMAVTLDCFAEITGDTSIEKNLQKIKGSLSTSNYSSLAGMTFLILPQSISDLSIYINSSLFYGIRTVGTSLLVGGIPLSNMLVTGKINSIIKNIKENSGYNASTVKELIDINSSIEFSNYIHYAGLLVLGASLMMNNDNLLKIGMLTTGSAAIVLGVPYVRFGVKKKITNVLLELEVERVTGQEKKRESASESKNNESIKKDAKDLSSIKGITVTEDIDIENVVMSVSAEKLGFTPQQASINQQGRSILHDIADFLRDYPEEEVVVAGYSDSGTSASGNSNTGIERAKAVKSFFVDEENLPALNIKTKLVTSSIAGDIFSKGVTRSGNAVDTILTAEKQKIQSVSQEKLQKLNQNPIIDVSMQNAGKRTRINVNESAIHFDFNSDIIDIKDYGTLDKIAGVCKSKENSTIMVNGHTDNVGDDVYNLKLSVRRANSVVNYFVKRCGIFSDIIEYKGYGEAMPISSNDTPEGRAQNRRVEILINTKNK